MSAGQGSGPRGSQTQFQSSAPRTSTTTTAPQAVLRLRGAPREEVQGNGEGSERRRIQWAEDVIDNEGMGKKKSKVCCIYHAPRGIDESSDESSSDSDSDSDSGDDGAARPSKRGRGRDHDHDHDHNHDHDHDHDHGKGKGRRRSPNAYERVPKPKGAAGPKQKG